MILISKVEINENDITETYNMIKKFRKKPWITNNILDLRLC